MQLITAVQAEERPAIGRRSACAPFHIDARKLTHFYGQAYTYSLTALIMNGLQGRFSLAGFQRQSLWQGVGQRPTFRRALRKG